MEKEPKKTTDPQSVIWEGNADIYEEFFKRVCALPEAEDTEENRVKILVALAKEKRMIRVTATGRSKEQIKKDYARHNKILDIRPNENPKV